MTMKSGLSPRSSKACSKSSSPKRNQGSPCYYRRYLKPGALAKLRDSKITATYHRHTTSLSELLLIPTSPLSSPTDQQPLNQDNGVPCFASASRINFNRPHCLHRKKLFAVTPFFTEADTYNF